MREEKSKTALATSREADVQTEENVESIMRLEKEAIHSRSPGEQIADKVTNFAGSTTFIIVHLFWFSAWVLTNVGLIPGVIPFDPFPFSFLTLVVSLEAIFLTLLVLMSQNRLTKEADKRAHLDLQVNMLAEQEATVILRTVQRIAKQLGVEEGDQEVEQLKQKTDVHRLAKTLSEKSPD